MGQWVILIGDNSFSLDSFSDMKFYGKTELKRDKHYIQVLFQNGYATFDEDYDLLIRNDYEIEEINNLPFTDAKMIMLTYSNIDILKNIVCEEAFPKDIIIDCDGVDLGLDTVIEKRRLINDMDLCEKRNYFSK